ncbi:hypothetical protein BB561_004336 [Smittium simulii]|uniref:Uncharacterized protein n=1 Tax=Smittium simulii TaxID=133385 RepID=A0A2T9YGU4_9FUNG|nr:hypothetical protein BB561_004336 [Smittium simulii]
MDNELTQDENIKKIDRNSNFELFSLNKIDVFSECNITLTWNNITKTLKTTPKPKAAGIHGIPNFFWKLVNKAWNKCNLIDSNNTDAVVSTFKRKNCQNPNKYYDIFLTFMVIKIIDKLVAIELNTLDSKYNIVMNVHLDGTFGLTSRQFKNSDKIITIDRILKKIKHISSLMNIYISIKLSEAKSIRAIWLLKPGRLPTQLSYI